MEGGLGLLVPSKSVVGAPVDVPAPFAGESLRRRRFDGAPWNSGSRASEAVPNVSPVLVAPFTRLPKNRLSATDDPLAVIAPAIAGSGVPPPLPEVAAF